MPSIVERLKIQAEDKLRYNPSVRNILASTILMKAPRAQAADTAEAPRVVHRLCQAARLAASESMMRRAEAAIARQLPAIDPGQVPWAEFLPDFGQDKIQKAIVLKRFVSEREKSIVLDFLDQMARLAKARDLGQFAARLRWCSPLRGHRPTRSSLTCSRASTRTRYSASSATGATWRVFRESAKSTGWFRSMRPTGSTRANTPRFLRQRRTPTF